MQATKSLFLLLPLLKEIVTYIMVIAYCLQALHRRGGIERVISSKANYWVQHGHTVHIITTDQRGSRAAFDLDDRVQLHDLELNYEQDNALGRWRRLWALCAKRGEHKRRLEALLAEIKPDITVSTFFQDAPLLPSLRDGSLKVLELHSSRYRWVYMYPKEKRLLRAIGYLRSLNDKRIAKGYDHFVVLTTEETTLWGNMPNISAIANPSPFTPQTEDNDLSREKVVLAVGRMEYEKNFSGLINIWKLLPRELSSSWRLEILGDGPLRGRLQEQVDGLGLSEYINLPGCKESMREHYMHSSIYAMTSHYEGLPMVLLEAQACGLPIVSYSCSGGPRDIISHGESGYLIEPGNERAFAEALAKLMGDEAIRQKMSAEAIRSSERYQIEPIMAQWEELFGQLLHTRH